jgi:catechol 2,3-dioxygenase-like lactoylglutathione lyase family enzyme
VIEKRLLAGILMAAPLFAQAAVKRPRILGVAHMALFVSDLAKTRAFYEDFLGFGEPFTLPKKDGSVRIAFIKVNENQYFEIFNEDPRDDGRLYHIAIYTDSAEQMRDYLTSKGVEAPEKVSKGKTGNKNYFIKDPDGHIVEIVEYQPDSWTARETGKFMPAARISDHIMHVGILVGSLEKSMKFYGDILGFKEFWRGSGGGKTLSWVNMRVPDGQDYVEFMLYRNLPPPDERGVKNHVCLVVSDVPKAVALLEARPARKLYSQKIEVKVGVNRKRQANLFDPDGTRIELMEADTVDGKPTPSSTAPPPQ